MNKELEKLFDKSVQNYLKRKDKAEQKKEADKTTKKKYEPKQKEKRSRWIQFVLYPENRYHMQYLDWAKHHEYGFYIVHDGEGERNGECGYISEQKDEKKKHIHCAVYFENARTASAFIKSLGTVEYWVVEEDEIGNPITLSSVPLADGQERTIVKPFLHHAEAVNDMNAVAHYFIHDNFECAMLGKKKYNKEDVKMLKNDRSVFDRYFSDEMPTNHATLELLIELWKCSNGSKETFLQNVLTCGDTRALKYLESRAYFISEFICGGSKKDA